MSSLLIGLFTLTLFSPLGVPYRFYHTHAAAFTSRYALQLLAHFHTNRAT